MSTVSKSDTDGADESKSVAATYPQPPDFELARIMIMEDLRAIINRIFDEERPRILNRWVSRRYEDEECLALQEQELL